jgi:hypothetical protein
MALDLDDDIREPIPLVLPLDRATVAWLTALAGGSDEQAAEIVASMLHDIRVDDEAEHATKH